MRMPVIRRPAFDDVGNIHLTAFELDGQQHIVEQPARMAHKRLACRILISTRCFTDEQPVCLLISNTEHRLRAACSQSAQLAAPYFFLELGEGKRTQSAARIFELKFAQTIPALYLWHQYGCLRLNNAHLRHLDGLLAPHPHGVHVQLAQHRLFPIHEPPPEHQMPSLSHPRCRLHCGNKHAAR